MSLNGKRHCAERAKKLRSILRDHYIRDDLSRSLEMLIADAIHLCDQRSLVFNHVEEKGREAYALDRVEARK